MSIDYIFEVILAYAPLLAAYVPYFCAICGVLVALNVLYHFVGVIK